MKHIIFFFSLLFLFSCTGKKQNSSTIPNEQDSLAPPQVIVLADLPDSLQPKVTLLDSVPTPLSVTVPNQSGGSYHITNASGRKISIVPPVTNSLPVLLDGKGKPIKDSQGNTFIMGDGGVSHFAHFTTDNGLALDAIRCSAMDNAGNLWFGTAGGGVSRYDGRSFTNFSIEHGLVDNMVRVMCVDKAGNLWFGTGAGVSRYDGRSFTTFSTKQGLASNSIRCIAVDKAGNIWFGTHGDGVSRYDGKSFTTFSVIHGLVNNQVRSICEDRMGNIWFGTDGGGVSRYDPSATEGKGATAFTNFSTADGLAHNTVLSICEDRSGDLWFGTAGGGVSRYDGHSFAGYSTGDGLGHTTVTSIVEDKSGNLWFGTYRGGVSRYERKQVAVSDSNNDDKRMVPTAFTTFSKEQGLADNSIRCITLDKMGNLWFGTGSSGVNRYDGSTFTTFSTVHGLPGNSVRSIAEDRMGNMWFGTRSGGACRFDGKSFTAFSSAQGLPYHTVMVAAVDNTGGLWLGTPRGACHFDGKSFTSFTTSQGLGGNNISGIIVDTAGIIWFGGYGGGLSRYNGRSVTSFTTKQGLASNSVMSIIKDKKGNIWVATKGGGVSCYDGQSITSFTTAHGLASNKVYCLTEDRNGNIWCGTIGGVSVISKEVVGRIGLGAQIGPKDKYSSSAPSSSWRHIFKTFGKKEGLPDNFVTQVLQMPDGKIAIGTNLGISLLTPSEDLTTLTNIEIYNANTGCPIKDVNTGQNGMFVDSKGGIWAGTGSERTALVRFDPSTLRSNLDTPSLVIKSIKVNEAQICWNDLLSAGQEEPGATVDSNVTPVYVAEEVNTTGNVLTETERDSMRRRFHDISLDGVSSYYPIPEHLTLPFKYNRVTIDFNAIEVSKPNTVNYQYMLEGYDNEWSPVMKQTSATFGNILEGSYTFKVKAQGPNGIWCAPVSFSFNVLPPWYRTWWAYGVYGMVFLLALRIFSKWRVRTLRNEKETLERTVAVRTSEVVAEKKELIKEKQRSDELLLNILPEEVAEELKQKGTTTARHYDNVTVLFTDFVDFTKAGESMSPQNLIDELHTCFKAFDEIAEKYNIEKIKTIGDAYLAVAGLPTADPEHAENIVNAAKEIIAFMDNRLAKMGMERTFHVRIGIHSGSVVAGIVGVKKFAYDIWGDTVNTAARMEQNSEAGKINISQTTYDLVKHKFTCEYRGEVEAKGKGVMKMYYVSSVIAV